MEEFVNWAKRVRIGAMIAAGFAIVAVVLSSIDPDGKVLLAAVVAGALVYALCISSDVELRIEHVREALWPLLISTGCYLLASATLSESVLELLHSWDGGAGFAMLYFLRVVILPCSAIGLGAAILMTRMGLRSGRMLVVFHALIVLLVMGPMLVYG